MAADAKVEEVVRLIHGMVEPGGGEVALTAFDATSRDLTVTYRASVTGVCSIEDGGACAITPAMIGDFLRESFKSRGLKIGDIKVEAM
ncbi:MAG TPA: hypothetical protein VHE77_20460 [Dongiaceae bacterium]|nr:hypothetical protein [Dongiaceae bacterium]